MKKYLLLIAFIGVLAATGSSAAYAQQNGNLTYSPLEPVPGVTTTDAVADFSTLIKTVFRILFSLAALLAVAMLVVGGVEYMISDVVNKKFDGLKRAQAAMWGVAILAGSWLLLNTINPELLNFKLPAANSSSVGGTGGTSGGAATGFSNYGASSNLAKKYAAIYGSLQDTKSGSAIAVVPNSSMSSSNVIDSWKNFYNQCQSVGYPYMTKSLDSTDTTVLMCLKK